MWRKSKMKNFDEIIVAKLLSATGDIIEKYDAISCAAGRDFNIFDITRIDDKEVIVCRVLAELLDPKGRHGQGGAYLELFLSDCLDLKFSENEINNANVVPEYPAAGRFIDIVVEISGKFIPIEVKIYAGDQIRQCYDYCMYARKYDKDAKIVYLTRFGNEPQDYSKGELKSEDIILLSFEIQILNWLEKCLALPDTIRKTPIREILIQFIAAINKITNQLEDKPMNEIIKLLSESEENMRNAKIIADTLEKCRPEMIQKFFDAIHEKFKGTFERAETEWDYDKQKGKEISPLISYIFKRNAIPDISILFCITSDKWDNLFAGFSIIRNGERKCFEDKSIIESFRKFYDIEEKKRTNWWICYEYIIFEGEQINLYNLNGNYNNYFKLFDPKKFDEIVGSTVEQAKAVFAKFKNDSDTY